MRVIECIQAKYSVGFVRQTEFQKEVLWKEYFRKLFVVTAVMRELLQIAFSFQIQTSL
jgi:hypothetical protein